MTDQSTDELRLRATEAQMRRALGLHEQPSSVPERISSAQTPVGATHPNRRRFVRDGEVPVAVIHRDHDAGAGTNKLDAARQALREQIAAREQAEHVLQEARITVQELRTKLVHEQMAKDEAVRRVEDERQAIQQALQTVQDQLTEERACRERAEQERDQAIAARREAEGRLRELTAVEAAPTIWTGRGAGRTGAAHRFGPEAEATADAISVVHNSAGETKETLLGPKSSTQPRRRGRPPRVEQPQPETDVVEWWKPGWRERLR